MEAPVIRDGAPSARFSASSRFVALSDNGLRNSKLTCITSAKSAGGEYFQVLFSDVDDSDEFYFLIQRQFESDDGGLLYVETHEQTLCGRFKIKNAELGRSLFRVDLVRQPAETIEIEFQADHYQHKQLERVLKIMIPSRFLKNPIVLRTRARASVTPLCESPIPLQSITCRQPATAIFAWACYTLSGK